MPIPTTGGAAFVVSHLSDDLLAHGHDVRVLDDLIAHVHHGRMPRPTPEHTYARRIGQVESVLAGTAARRVVRHAIAVAGVPAC